MVQIVCVDDNETMLDLTADILRLERSECDIHTFVSAKQALAFMRENGCDLLLTDFSMPGMNGVELITHVKTLDSGIYCILVTGSSPYALREHYPGDVFDGLLKKPYSYRELLSLIDVGLKVRAEQLSKKTEPASPEKASSAEPRITREAAVREARAFLGKVWEEADLASPPLDLEYGCQNPAHFAVRVKEEISRAMRYSRSFSILKIDLNDITQARAELGLEHDTDLAKMVLRIITPNIRSSDLVTYRHPWILLLMPEAGEPARQRIGARLLGSLRSRGILIAKGPDVGSGVVLSSQTYSFEKRESRRSMEGEFDSDD